MVKDARKVGRLGEGLTQWAGRSAREVVDAPMLQQAVASGSVLRPGQTVSAIQAAFRAEKAGALVRLAKDVGRVGEKAGMRGALDTLRIAEGPKDVARAARLAESKGGQTRAILKLLGRGALLLAAGAFDLTLWVLARCWRCSACCRRSRRPPSGRPWHGCATRKPGACKRWLWPLQCCLARLWRAPRRAAKPAVTRPFGSPNKWIDDAEFS
jgi:hypothetical protein